MTAVILARTTLLALALSATPEQANPADDPSKKADANLLLSQGADAYSRGDYQAAWRDFVLAHEQVPSPKLEFNIGQTLLKLDRKAEAAEAFEQFLVGTATDAKLDYHRKLEATQLLDKLRANLVQVTLEVAPDNARVTVDGRAVAAGTVYLPADHADHVFEAVAPGLESHRATVVGDPAQKMPLRVHLQLAEVGPPPSAQPAVATTLVSPAPEGSPSHLPAYLTWGAGGVCALGGLIVGIEALSLGQAIGSVRGTCSGSNGRTNDTRCGTWNAEATVADVLWGAAAAGGIAGTVLYVMPPTSGSGGEVGIVGRF